MDGSKRHSSCAHGTQGPRYRRRGPSLLKDPALVIRMEALSAIESSDRLDLKKPAPQACEIFRTTITASPSGSPKSPSSS